MTSFPGSPRILKGGIVLVDPDTSAVLRIITMQYNPESLSRSLQVQGAGGEGGGRSEALRLKGPPVETLKVEAEIDATDQLEIPDQNLAATTSGIYPQLAALETLVYPASGQMIANSIQAQLGVLEIAPMEMPLTVFVWSKNRVLPVRLTEFSITEEAFDPSLNPIRAKVSLGMRVLSVDDLGFAHRGSSTFLSYLQQKESLVAQAKAGVLTDLGITRIP